MIAARRTISPVLVSLTVALAAALSATPALARDGQVTVRAAGTTNESVTVKLAELGTNDINNRQYRLRNGQVTISGHSLLQVMNRADAESDAIDLATVPSIAIDRPSGSPITISGSDLRDPGAFPDGPPVFYEDNGATVFVMPGSPSGASGNRYRFEQAPVGITIGSGASYEIDLSASRTKVNVGQKVSFTAVVSGQEKGESLSFSWNFNDGSSRTTSEARVSHTFTRKGTFPVILDVSGTSGSGQSGLSIEVGEVRKKPDRKTPDRQPQGNPDSTGQTGSGGGFGDGFGGGFGGGTGSFGTGTGSGVPGGFAPPVQPAVPAPSPAPQQDRRQKPDTPPGDGLTEVRGELVDPATATVVSPDQLQTPETANPAPSGTEQGGFGIPGEAWAVAGIGLLLGLGGIAELRVFSRLY